MKSHYLPSLANITTFIFDVDGVLTDGKILFMPDGEALRTINTKDGFAIFNAVEAGYRFLAITRAGSPTLKAALDKLGFEDVALRVMDKLDKYEEFQHIYEFKDQEVLYMGDDLPDLCVMRKAAVAACPQDAAHEIREYCSYISPFKGGSGCVRDVIEKVMRAQNKWSEL